MLLAVVAVLAVLAAALTGRAVASREPAEQPVKIRVALTQDRGDEVRRTVQVAMHNDGPAPITVVRVEVQAPSVKGVGPVPVDAPLPVGGLHVDLPVPYGTGICDGAIDCRQAYLDRQVSLSFGQWTRLPGGRVTGTLVLKRAGFPGTVTLQEFAGSILLQVRPAPLLERTPKPYGVLRPGMAELTVTDVDRAAVKPVVDACAARRTPA